MRNCPVSTLMISSSINNFSMTFSRHRWLKFPCRYIFSPVDFLQDLSFNNWSTWVPSCYLCSFWICRMSGHVGNEVICFVNHSQVNSLSYWNMSVFGWFLGLPNAVIVESPTYHRYKHQDQILEHSIFRTSTLTAFPTEPHSLPHKWRHYSLHQQILDGIRIQYQPSTTCINNVYLYTDFI